MKKTHAFLANKFKPSQLSYIYIFGALAVIFVVSWIFLQFTSPQQKQIEKKSQITNILNTSNTRELSIEAINDQFRDLVHKNDELQAQVKQLTELRNRDQEKIQSSVVLTQKVKSLEAQLNTVNNKLVEQGTLTNQQLADVKDSLATEIKVATELGATKSNTTTQLSNDGKVTLKSESAKRNIVPDVKRNVETNSFIYTDDNQVDNKLILADNDTRSVRSRLAPIGDTYRPEQSTTHYDKRTPQLMTIVESPTVESEQYEFYIPRGSILTGILITGADVPTSSKTIDNPHPVLVRIKKDAILANNNRMGEVKECFALMGGYGSMSTERAYFRGESITCILHDKTVIEANLGGYAVGEDGKAGLKGRLVTRNGKVLANTMIAGFGSGLAKAFDVSPVPVISTSTDGNQQYQDVFSSSAIQGGAAKGASSAMEKLADYYMKLADEMHPVIEIGAGRVIDIIVSTGSENEK
ncbi:TPA: TrbI/VirB10 family protein [Photobacterium damselae]